MNGTFSASIVCEDEWYIAQCSEVDVASQGETADKALQNVGEALALYFDSPHSAASPVIRSIEVEIGAAVPVAERKST